MTGQRKRATITGNSKLKKQYLPSVKALTTETWYPCYVWYGEYQIMELLIFQEDCLKCAIHASWVFDTWVCFFAALFLRQLAEPSVLYSTVESLQCIGPLPCRCLWFYHGFDAAFLCDINIFFYCETQSHTVQRLSSSIFTCSFVRPSAW